MTADAPADPIFTKADWERRTQRRETMLIEHVCAHGIGHPNPGSALHMAECGRMSAVERAAQAIEAGEEPGEISSLDEWFHAWMSHGCDGCCRSDTFPDFRDSLLHAHALIHQRNAYIAALMGLLRAAEIELPDEPPLRPATYLGT